MGAYNTPSNVQLGNFESMIERWDWFMKRTTHISDCELVLVENCVVFNRESCAVDYYQRIREIDTIFFLTIQNVAFSINNNYYKKNFELLSAL